MAIVVTRSAGMIVLAVWLILQGLLALVSFALPPLVMPILALVAGVLILIGK
jgi:hypothetical protein